VTRDFSIGITVTRNDLSRILGKFGSAQWQRDLMHDVTYEFWNITRMNFGINGIDRPSPWPPLSEKYQKQLRRKSFGTPLVPTLLRTGTLLNSIRVGQITATEGHVWTDCPYAAVHQFGKQPQPLRPFFPITSSTSEGGEATLTPYAQSRIDGIIERKVAALSH